MERNVLVDRLKGYACFLVLFGHVIRGIRNAGIGIPSFFEGMELFIWSFHVALFLFLSGVVYRLTGEWRGHKTRWGFILHKLLALGIPYVVFSAVYIAINSFVGEANTQSAITDILFIWKTPVAQYWYLYALFFLFCIWALLSGILKNWMITIITLVIGYGIPLLGGTLGCFEVVFYSSLAFGIGTFISFNSLAKPKAWFKWVVVAAHIAIGVTFILLKMIESPIVKEFMILLGIYASILLISMLQKIKIIARFLDFINKYSFQIYLLHTIFTAGIRIILVLLSITQWWIHVPVGTVCGIFFSVLAAIIAKKVKFLNFFFFPTKAFKKERVVQK